MDQLEVCETRMVDLDRVAEGKQHLLADPVYADVTEIFRALGDPSRAKVVYSLLHQELCVCDLAAIVGLSESATSQHLRVLRGLRLVKSRRDGKMVYYSLDDQHIQTLLDVCLSHVAHRSGIKAADLVTLGGQSR